MSRTDLALRAVILLGALAAAITGDTAMVILLCFLMWRLDQ